MKNVLIIPRCEAGDVLMIVLIFFPHLSLNVLINKVLSQRKECKARKKNKAGYKAPSSRTVGQGQSVESRHTRVGDKKDRWTDKACQIAAVRRKYHNSYIFTQRL